MTMCCSTCWWDWAQEPRSSNVRSVPCEGPMTSTSMAGTRTSIPMGTAMDDMRIAPSSHGFDEAILPLFAWLSPSYPVGCYAYSHTLEWAVEAGDVTDEATLVAWLI